MLTAKRLGKLREYVGLLRILRKHPNDREVFEPPPAPDLAFSIDVWLWVHSCGYLLFGFCVLLFNLQTGVALVA